MKLCKIESFIHQLDLETSFEQRALPCAALLYKTRIRNRSVQSFQLTGQHLSFALVSGGVHLRAFNQSALQTRTLTALTLISLSLAIIAWLKPSSKRAWRRSPLRRSLCTISLPATSFRRSASTTAFPTTSFRTTSSFRRTFLWFSFLFSIFFSNSFRGKELVEHNELSQTVLEQELEELLANKPCPLDPLHDHLGQENLWPIQLQQNNLEKNKNKLDHNQPRENTVPDRELSQLHLHQLCLQDPASTRQLPEESLSSSFSKKKLSEQDLSNISLAKFFPEN